MLFRLASETVIDLREPELWESCRYSCLAYSLWGGCWRRLEPKEMFWILLVSVLTLGWVLAHY